MLALLDILFYLSSKGYTRMLLETNDVTEGIVCVTVASASHKMQCF